jgi:tRNA(fMet)-specific endonuclease VapC
MIILDSDIFTLLTYNHVNVCRHYDAVAEDEVLAVTAITRMEVLRGRTDGLLKASDETELLLATKRLQTTEAALVDFFLVHVDEAAAEFFETLQREKKVSKMKRADMLIACIALANDALLVTRNTKDFKGVKGLKLANWADD